MSNKLSLAISSLLALFIIASGFIACGNDDDSELDTDPKSTEPGEFGDSCESASDCAEEWNVCHEFGQLGFVCTMTCKKDAECPDGTEGKKCNNSGVCRP